MRRSWRAGSEEKCRSFRCMPSFCVYLNDPRQEVEQRSSNSRTHAFKYRAALDTSARYRTKTCNYCGDNYATNMDDRPILVSPPTPPTPPPDNGEGLDRFQNSPTKSVFDPTSLSPMDENFPTSRYGSMHSPGFQSTTLPLGSADTNSLYSPMSVESTTSYGSYGSAHQVEDPKGVFNFQPLTMPKSSVTKSVSSP